MEEIVEFAFATKLLREVCENRAIAERQLGPRVAARLRARLADLQAATNVGDLVAGRPHEIDNGQRLAFELSEGFRLVLGSNHNVVPRRNSPAVDWRRVSRVQILKIEANNE